MLDKPFISMLIISKVTTCDLILWKSPICVGFKVNSFPQHGEHMFSVEIFLVWKRS